MGGERICQGDAELELKEEEEWKIWEEEEQELHLASAQEKRWLAELAAQWQLERLVEENKGEGSQ